MYGKQACLNLLYVTTAFSPWCVVKSSAVKSAAALCTSRTIWANWVYYATRV